LNLLRSARSNPKLSAYAYLFRNFNFQATPLAPPCTRVVAYKTKNTRTIWASHGEDGGYVGPALKQYHCASVYFPKTRTVRHVDTARYLPDVVPVTLATLEDHLRQASINIIAILTNPPSKVAPELESGDKVQNKILKLATILNNADKIPNLPKSQNTHNKYRFRGCKVRRIKLHHFRG